jgi:Na+/proline symporter
VPRLYRAGTVTIYGYLGKRFGETSVIAVSSAFLFGRILASGSRLFLAALPLCLLIFGHANPSKGQQVFAVCMIGLVGTLYTVAGGVRAVIWTDTIQFFIVVGTVLLSIGMLLHRIPLSPSELWHALGQPGTGVGPHSKLHLVDTALDFSKPFTLWSALFGVVFLNMAVYGVDHDFAQRFLVSKSPVRGAVSMIASQFISVAVVALFVTIGLLLYVYYRRPDLMGAAAPGYRPDTKPEMAYPLFLLKELPPVLSGLAIAGFFAIAQGSMDSATNAMASSAVADLYFPIRRRLGHDVDPQRDTHAPRLAVAMMGGLMTLFDVVCVVVYDPTQKTLLNFVLGIMGFAYAGMLGVFLAALFTRRGNNATVIAALFAGVITVTLLQDGIYGWWTGRLLDHPSKLAWPWWLPIGTTVAFLICVTGRGRATSSPVARRGFETITSAQPTAR